MSRRHWYLGGGRWSRGGVWGEEDGGTTFRERREEAATLYPKTTSRSHAQAVFL